MAWHQMGAKPLSKPMMIIISKILLYNIQWKFYIELEVFSQESAVGIIICRVLAIFIWGEMS